RSIAKPTDSFTLELFDFCTFDILTNGSTNTLARGELVAENIRKEKLYFVADDCYSINEAITKVVVSAIEFFLNAA
ncbi:MAG: hypothetical protein ACOYMN_19105, partial [Roseimicrobium sp.]